MLYALKGGGKRAFYRWLVRDWQAWFPRLPSRTRLFRLFATHADWTDRFRAEPTPLGVVDSYGIELIHPVRQGRARHSFFETGVNPCALHLLADVDGDGNVDLLGSSESREFYFVSRTYYGLDVWQLDALGGVSRHSLLSPQVHVSLGPLPATSTAMACWTWLWSMAT